VESLELQQNRAKRERPRGDDAAGERFERPAVRQRMAHARVSGNALGELARACQRQRLEQLLRALVHEAEARLEVDDRLALETEAEVAGLDDAGVHGPHRDLEDALALDATEGEWLPLVAEVGSRRRVAAQRMISVRPELMKSQPAQVGMAVRHDAEQIVHLPL